MTRNSRARTIALVALLATLCSGAVSSVSAHAASWPSLARSTIHPGVQTITGGAQCTANFVFTNGTSVLLGQAAHCAGTGAANDTNGCTATTRPLGTLVEIAGASRPGVLVYSSWIAMQANRESNDALCRYNDFALVRIDPADVTKLNPSVPRWGGPTGLAVAPTSVGDKVYSLGNSGLRFGISQLMPKLGFSLGTSGQGRTHAVYTATPGIPGDSGSGLLNANGRALGVLSTVSLAPLPLSNNYGDLNSAVGYARAHNFAELRLVPGTKPFDGRAIRLLLN